MAQQTQGGHPAVSGPQPSPFPDPFGPPFETSHERETLNRIARTLLKMNEEQWHQLSAELAIIRDEYQKSSSPADRAECEEAAVGQILSFQPSDDFVHQSEQVCVLGEGALEAARLEGDRLFEELMERHPIETNDKQGPSST
jgi:hypothetical protein